MQASMLMLGYCELHVCASKRVDAKLLRRRAKHAIIYNAVETALCARVSLVPAVGAAAAAGLLARDLVHLLCKGPRTVVVLGSQVVDETSFLGPESSDEFGHLR